MKVFYLDGYPIILTLHTGVNNTDEANQKIADCFEKLPKFFQEHLNLTGITTTEQLQQKAKALYQKVTQYLGDKFDQVNTASNSFNFSWIILTNVATQHYLSTSYINSTLDAANAINITINNKQLEISPRSTVIQGIKQYQVIITDQQDLKITATHPTAEQRQTIQNQAIAAQKNLWDTKKAIIDVLKQHYLAKQPTFWQWLFGKPGLQYIKTCKTMCQQIASAPDLEKIKTILKPGQVLSELKTRQSFDGYCVPQSYSPIPAQAYDKPISSCFSLWPKKDKFFEEVLIEDYRAIPLKS